MERHSLDLAFVSDVACPWCAIGLASLEQALARLGDEVTVNLHFEPFELNPDMGPEGAAVVPYLGRKYGRTPEQVAEVQARIRARGADVGFAFGPREHVWNTFDAHRIAALGRRRGPGAGAQARAASRLSTARDEIRARPTSLVELAGRSD